MKPTKNNFFCPACKHTKILFQSKQEAILFLKFNANAIEQETGKRPVRAYYCKFCGGWHVTSRPHSFGIHQLMARFGVDEGEKFYLLIKPYVKPGKSIQKCVMDKIKILKRNLRYVTVDIERCKNLIYEIADVMKAIGKAQVVNRDDYGKLLDAFKFQVNIFFQKQGIN